ncbi:MAG TPA: aminotransferase class IV [Anaeromyxobacter sp.]|nr:aminotransferase class IV [Anaeromyxobacter sp.]
MPSPILVNLDGELLRPAEAKISVLDRGFLHGDSVYEVIRTYRGRPFELAAHLERLTHSAKRLALAPRWSTDRVEVELYRTLRAVEGLPPPPPDPLAAPWNAGQWSIRVVMTRGAGEVGLDPALAVDPQAVLIVQPLAGPAARAYAEGVKVILASTPRPPPEAVDPTAKTGGRVGHVLAVREARDAGAEEALFLDAQGRVTEGCSSNVFAVRGGRLVTPSLAAGILAGVTRAVVLRLARQQGVGVEETALRPGDLYSAEEVFITSTAREVLPVTRVDRTVIGAGIPGSLTRRLQESFRAATASL